MIRTIGHGNRSIEGLKEAGIEYLVDVRAYPASRRHAGKGAISSTMPENGGAESLICSKPGPVAGC